MGGIWECHISFPRGPAQGPFQTKWCLLGQRTSWVWVCRSHSPHQTETVKFTDEEMRMDDRRGRWWPAQGTPMIGGPEFFPVPQKSTKTELRDLCTGNQVIINSFLQKNWCKMVRRNLGGCHEKDEKHLCHLMQFAPAQNFPNQFYLLSPDSAIPSVHAATPSFLFSRTPPRGPLTPSWGGRPLWNP